MQSDQSFPQRLSGADDLMWRRGRSGAALADPRRRGARPRANDRGRAYRTRLVAGAVSAAAAAAGHRAWLVGRAHWVTCDDTSLDYHVRRVRVPDPADIGVVLGVVEPTVTAAFDVARPLWELTIVDGLAGGRALSALRFHHTVTDGVGVSSSPGSSSTAPAAAEGPAAARIHLGSGASIANPLVKSRRGRMGIHFGVDAARHPVATIQQGRRLAGSFARALTPGPAGSPVFDARGLERQLDVLEAPLVRFEQAADLIGCTVNDVFLAAVGGRCAAITTSSAGGRGGPVHDVDQPSRRARPPRR